MLSPKGGIVGETERRSRLQRVALTEWTPNVAFIDEVTEAFPLERSEFNGDSGASDAVRASLLTSLSDESRRGRSLLIATTNCPLGGKIQSRPLVLVIQATDDGSSDDATCDGDALRWAPVGGVEGEAAMRTLGVVVGDGLVDPRRLRDEVRP